MQVTTISGFQRRWALTLLCCLLGCTCVLAQPTVSSKVDKTQLLIGDQFKLTVKANLGNDQYYVRWLKVPDSIPHFELVAQSGIDSVMVNGQLQSLSQDFTFTSFDSGKFTLPVFDIGVDPVNDDTTFRFLTDSIAITVAYQADTSKALRPIKTILPAPAESLFWYWVGGVAVLLIVLLLVGWWYRRWKMRTVPRQKLQQKATAYQSAMAALQQLEQLDLSQAPNIRLFHTGLVDVFKQYLWHTRGHKVQPLTSSDLLLYCRDAGFYGATMPELAPVLRMGDAVKFARYLPAVTDSTNSLQQIKAAITFIDQLTKQPTSKV